MRLAAIVLMLLLAPRGEDSDLWKRVPVIESASVAGHVCPVAWGVLTARHVIDNEVELSDRVIVYGSLMPEEVKYHLALDAAAWEGALDGVEPFELYLGPMRAKQKVRLVGFSNRGGPAIVKAETVHPYGGTGIHWLLSKSGHSGSSGSCVVNSDEKVIGLNIATFIERDGDREFGVFIPARMLTREWFDE